MNAHKSSPRKKTRVDEGCKIETEVVEMEVTEELASPIISVNPPSPSTDVNSEHETGLLKSDLIEFTELESEKELKGKVFMVPPVLAVRQFAYQERIPISIDEIRRRINPPESLSQALILNLLRLNKDRAKQLKKALNLFGIKELPGRSAVVSSFTRLSEVEASNLAEDYFFLASKYMKLKQMNNAIVQRNGGPQIFTAKAAATRKLLETIMTEIEDHHSNLNLLTHGFSSLILRAVFDILIEILTYREKELSDSKFST